MGDITATQCASLFPKADSRLYAPLNETFNRYGITTELRQAAFLAQVGHESLNFTIFSENLNYSTEGLLKGFPKYFKSYAQAQAYARQPEKIANYVYGNRMGNGPPSSGDGWLYRGRGAMQLTGKNNYMAFASAFGLSLPDAIKFVSAPRGAVLSAGWFWDINELNTLADQQVFKTLTKRINGGLNGYEHRLQLYESALKLL